MVFGDEPAVRGVSLPCGQQLGDLGGHCRQGGRALRPRMLLPYSMFLPERDSVPCSECFCNRPNSPDFTP